ncbi:hypothetical protein BKA62DRAFT_688634 [Auriculariales sp. MPI-PUGE-AT-0066]|nr:hypothetical protein BKA62DRAFT_688634 [Auriculariales sp. MPI-PUGE-AT-0066]
MSKECVRRESKAGRQPYEGCKGRMRKGSGSAGPVAFQAPRIDLVDEWNQAGDPLPPAPVDPIADAWPDDEDADGETDSEDEGDSDQMHAAPEASSQPTDSPTSAAVQARVFNEALVQTGFKVELTSNFSDPPAQAPPVTQPFTPDASRTLNNAPVHTQPIPRGQIWGFSPNPVLAHQAAIQHLPPPPGQVFMRPGAQGNFGVVTQPVSIIQRPVTRYLPPPPPAPVPQQSFSASTSSVFMQQPVSIIQRPVTRYLPPPPPAPVPQQSFSANTSSVFMQQPTSYPQTYQQVYPQAIPLAQIRQTWYESDDLTPEVWADVLM